jgi:hypothetical protein
LAPDSDSAWTRDNEQLLRSGEKWKWLKAAQTYFISRRMLSFFYKLSTSNLQNKKRPNFGAISLEISTSRFRPVYLGNDSFHKVEHITDSDIATLRRHNQYQDSGK